MAVVDTVQQRTVSNCLTTAGVGIKVSEESERTRLISGSDTPSGAARPVSERLTAADSGSSGQRQQQRVGATGEASSTATGHSNTPTVCRRIMR